MVVWCGQGGAFYNLSIKFQCFNRPWSWTVTFTGVSPWYSFPYPLPCTPFPGCSLPNLFPWTSDPCWLCFCFLFLFSLFRWNRKPGRGWNGRVSLPPAGIRLWKSPFAGRVSFVMVQLLVYFTMITLPFPPKATGIFLGSSWWEPSGGTRHKAHENVGTLLRLQPEKPLALILMHVLLPARYSPELLFVFLPVYGSSSFCFRSASLTCVSLHELVSSDFCLVICPATSVLWCVQE